MSGLATGGKAHAAAAASSGSTAATGGMALVVATATECYREARYQQRQTVT